MPKTKTKESVLDGRAELLSFADKPGWYLRVYVPATELRGRHYKTKRINAETHEDALQQALDVYVRLAKKEDAEPPSRVTQTPVSNPDRHRQNNKSRGCSQARFSPNNLYQSVQDFIKWMNKRGQGKDLDETYVRNVRDTMLNHVLAYCQQHRLDNLEDIKLGVFDNYKLWRGDIRKHTLRTEMSVIKTWLGYLNRHELLPVKTAMNLSNLVVLPRLKDIDMQGNPPFTSEDWLIFNREIQSWVKEAEGCLPKCDYHNARVYHYRNMCWTLWMLLKTSGMRPSEARALRWNDIEFENVPRTRSTGEEQDRFFVHVRVLDSKTGAMREVTANCATRLLKWKEKVDSFYIERGFKCSPRDEKTLIFGDPYRFWSDYQYSNISKAWRDVRDRCEDNLKGPRLSTRPYTIYSLRATRVNELVLAGIDPLIIAKQLGHSPEMMMRYYERADIRQRAVEEAVIGAIPYGKKKRKPQLFTSEQITSKQTR